MTSIFDTVAIFIGSMNILDVLLHLALKSTIVLVIGFLIAGLAMRRSAAAARHQVWVIAFAAVALSIFWVRLVPFEPVAVGQRETHRAPSDTKMTMTATPDDSSVSSVRPRTTSVPVDASPRRQQTLSPLDEHGTVESEPTSALLPALKSESIAALATGAIPSIQAPMPSAEFETRATWAATLHTWTPILFGTWIAGVTLCCGFLCFSWLTLRLNSRRFKRVRDDRMNAMLQSLRSAAGIRREISLCESDEKLIPMTWGILKPGIVLPSAGKDWSDERLRMVLLHELAHVRRFDCLWQILVLVTLAVHWFNPLAWLAAKRMWLECEQACDDVVLSNGVAGADYATQLLDISTGGRRGVLSMCSGLAMARSHRLAERLKVIIDDSRDRRPLSSRALMTALLTAVLLMGPVSMGTHITLSAGSQEPPRLTEPVLVQALALPGIHKPSASEVASAAAPATANGTPKASQAVDVSEFSMVLSFHGESGKPFYGLVLTVGPTSIQQNEFVLYHRINKKQAEKIVAYLDRSGFFRHATVTNNQNDPGLGPQYLLRVRHEGKHYEESLDWGMETGLRLSGIQGSLEDDVAQSMDRLLDRLKGQKEVWESGKIQNGLKTTLSSDKKTFIAGEPIPVKVELSNVGKQTEPYPSYSFSRDENSFVVTDDDGRRLPFVYWPAGLRENRSEIAPSTTQVIEQSDLSSFYYLRRPGRYHVTFRSFGLPASNAFHFEVLPGDAAKSDGDPMGRLLPNVAGKWTPVGSPNASEKIRPGRNRREARGWSFGFPLTGRGFKGSKAFVWLWLMDEPAAEMDPPADDFLYPSDYVGKVSSWHTYVYTSPEALAIWPTAREDIKAALGGRQKESRN